MSMKVNSIVRRLLPVECERLMGFPDDYLKIAGDSTPDSPRYKGCGNSWINNNATWVNTRADIVLRETRIVDGDRPIHYATTCSGVECHTLSVRGLKWNANFYSEIEKFPCEVLAHHYPSVPNLGDMTKLDGRKYSLDVFSGGTPCQSVSVAGKRHGMAEGSDTRSSLAYHWLRIGNESVRPGGLMLWENVAGAFSSNNGLDFAWFIWRLNEEGWSVAWRCMDGQYIWSETPGNHFARAVPQRRRRIWLIAYKGDDWRIPCRVLMERQEFTGPAAPRRFVNGRFVESGKVQAVEQMDLFGAPEPSFNRDSRADMIPFSEMPGNGRFDSTRDVDLYSFFRRLGTITYFGGIFDGVASVENISGRWTEAIGNAGVAQGGRVCALKMPEWSAGIQLAEGTECPPEFDGTVCGLSDVLVPMSDDLVKYFLSSRACEGILRRAAARGKDLPEPLERALHEQIANWANGKFGEDRNDEDEPEETDESGTVAEECEE